MTDIHFNHGMMKSVAADYNFCEKQYEKALRVLDRSTKIREQSALYITRQLQSHDRNADFIKIIYFSVYYNFSFQEIFSIMIR